jgi:hypothetical protein
MDDTISPSAESDVQTDNVEIPANIDTLTIDGTEPAIGDQVKLVVKGSVTRVVNKVAYVKPETVNDQPMEASILDPDPMESEKDRLRGLSQTVGALPSY